LGNQIRFEFRLWWAIDCDIGPNHMAARRIGRGHNSGHHHLRRTGQNSLNLGGANPIAA
jgi:hypothetical protein